MIKRAKAEAVEILANLALKMWTDHNLEDLAEEFRKLVMKRIIVCTSGNLVAPKNYELVRFQMYYRKPNVTESAYAGDYLYYEIIL